MDSSSITTSPKTLLPMSVPLSGRILIEASAGTGKTFTLSLLYLRLLLGIGDGNFPRTLSVNEILVVTFTQAATEELRYRIRENIHQLRIACLQGFHEAAIYQTLLEQIENRQYAIELLLYAEQQMDEAAIYTIHGFCQRILTTNAFESGVLFEQALVQDASQLYLQVVRDFWRSYFYPLPEPLAYIILSLWADPETLLADISPYLNSEIFTLETKQRKQQTIVEFISQYHQEKITRIESVKSIWKQNSEQVADLINQSDVSKQSYSSRYLVSWISQISDWANQPTRDYSLPGKLINFSQATLIEKTKKGSPPEHPLFIAIEQLYRVSFDLKSEILFDIVHNIKQGIVDEKLRRSEIGFDDLLTQLYRALTSKTNQSLVNVIAKRYPVAMIDEFQDTDPIQYQIFDQIYQDRKNTGLLLIGDPKQAIYGFRGADIFTYIQAKQFVDDYFTMDTNWRSADAMVAGVNQLFSVNKNPFIFDAIPFLSVNSAKKNKTKQFRLNNKVIPALQLCLLPEEITTVTDYQKLSAEYCAEQILTCLNSSQNENAWLIDNEQKKRLVTSADIAVLVRTGNEAMIIQEALSKRGVRSVYLSNRQSVFDSEEAKNMFWLLQAVLMPENERYVRTALSSTILSVNMFDLDEYNRDQTNWENVIEEFKGYQLEWQKQGVLVMLRRLMAQRYIAENILANPYGERILTNFMHLGELLQSVSGELDSPYALLRWLGRQINHPDPNLENQQQRLESDENLVKIITIHKSKGLEYPLVWLPFVCHYRSSDKKMYHDRDDFSIHVNLNPNEDELLLIEQERLAEDLRLLYVALTRSVYHCSIGVAGLKQRRSGETILHQSGLGYLVQHGQAGDYALFKNNVAQLEQIATSEIVLPIQCTSLSPFVVSAEQLLSANIFQRILSNHWRVSSYSGLQKNDATEYSSEKTLTEFLPKLDLEAIDNTPRSSSSTQNEFIIQQDMFMTLTEQGDSIHQFPKGAMVGTLLHSLMEKIDFNLEQNDLSENPILIEMVQTLKLSDNWLSIVSRWIYSILNMPLNADNLSLSQINHHNRLIELQFYLPIRHRVTAQQFDLLCKQYDPLSKQCPPLNFYDIEGMLKGFIDLVFEWQGRFYILDYKSNWLGNDVNAYTLDAIKVAMCEHRYDLQYQLYTLALHRYLQHRIPNYDYETHFGGVYYLFLRGMSMNNRDNGIFFFRPDIKFIEKLDQLFG